MDNIPLLLAMLGLLPFVAQAQPSTTRTAPPPQWHHLDPTADKTIGISTERAYDLLKTLPNQSRKPVIVAVIDGGLDLSHEDLKSVLWTNPKEVAGNGKDDDGNGYADDLHGWNFLGSKDGRNLEYEQKEETRLYARLKPLYDGKSRADQSPNRQKEFDLWLMVKPYYEKKRAKAEADYREDLALLNEDSANFDRLRKGLRVSVLDSSLLHKPPTTDSVLLSLATRYYRAVKNGPGFANTDSLLRQYRQFNEYVKAVVDREYSLTYNGRAMVGDDPANLTQHDYGNPDLTSPLRGRGTQHGTHVAGIIAADRTNAIGVKGIADNVRVLFVRAAPDGDERDKDVANAIHYAVDNGASIINMSFGKYFSPEKALVDEAMRYANQKGALIVHAAGNDRLDTDSARQYPNTTDLTGRPIPNLMSIGASDRINNSSMVAPFSNYGKQSVDVFAPGMMIWSCGPGSTYRPSGGTSMATPMVVGIAAVLKTYFPNLGPADLKRIIMKSAVPYHTQVIKPGTKQTVDFATLSKTGGIVNLYEAVKLAMSEQAASAKK